MTAKVNAKPEAFEEKIMTGPSVVKTTEDGDITEIIPVEKTDIPEYNPVLRIVHPHGKISREVTDADIERLLPEAYVLRDICFLENGMYHSAFAMAHAQIDHLDPLRFFVFADGRVMINPVITNKTKHPVDSDEGCMTFPKRMMKTLQRSHKVTVSYQTLEPIEGETDKYKLTAVMEGNYSGREAKIFQHEIDHMDAKYIFDDIEELTDNKDGENGNNTTVPEGVPGIPG